MSNIKAFFHILFLALCISAAVAISIYPEFRQDDHAKRAIVGLCIFAIGLLAGLETAKLFFRQRK